MHAGEQAEENEFNFNEEENSQAATVLNGILNLGVKMPLNAMNDGEIEMKTSSLLARTIALKIVKSMFPVVFAERSNSFLS